MEKQNTSGIEYEVGSGNVYADIELPDADKLKVKTYLVVEIMNAMDRLGLTQQQAAERMGLTQPKVSEMTRGMLDKFSERKLMECLNRLGYDIEIRLMPSTRPVGHFQVAVA